jgi:uncharacterized protein
MRKIIHLSVGSLVITTAAAAPAQSTCFDGVLGDGARARRVVVQSAGQDRALLHLFTRPARQVTLVQRADGVFAAGDSALLTSNNNGEPASLEVRRSLDTVIATLQRVASMPTPGATGEWTAAIGPGGVIRLVANISSLACGAVVGTFDSPDQGQRDLPFTSIRITRDSLIIAASYLDLEVALPFVGGDIRRSRMTQRGVDTMVEFRRGEASRVRRPQEPQRPFPYDERDVRFAGYSSRVQLSGTLTVPAGRGPHPAVVLISGSGAQDRDETIAGHKPFLVLADHLTRRGYAVLRFDDRPNAIQMTLEERANDVSSAVEFLQKQADIDFRRIGLIGHSEGGVVAPMVARAQNVAFLVLLGAPAVVGHQLFEAQATTMLRATGVNELEVRVDSLIRATVFDVLRTNPPDAAIAQRVDSAVALRLRGFGTADRGRADAWLAARSPAQDSAAIALWTSPWFKSLFHHDPAPLLRSMAVPVLAMYGSLDLQVPPTTSLSALERHFSGPRRNLLTAELLPGINHMMQPARSGSMDEYRTIEQTIAERVFVVLDAWLNRHVPLSRSP